MSSALSFAESSEWDELLHIIQSNPDSTHEIDDFGMMPLHWACTDRAVPPFIARALIRVYPEAVQIKNKGGLNPLHIAIKAKSPLDIIRILTSVSELSVCEETLAGETPAELAVLSQTSTNVINFLSEIETHLRCNGKAPLRASKLKSIILADRIKNQSLHKSPSLINQLSPCWKMDKRCKICLLKFSYFKSRHHCRNCGESVCNTHSNKRIALHHLGMESLHRVCIMCYDNLHANGIPSAVVNLFANKRSSHSRELAYESEKKNLYGKMDDDLNSGQQQPDDKDGAYGVMQQQVIELETHVKELQETKDKIQIEIDASSRKIKDVMDIRAANESLLHDAQKEFEIDLKRVLPVSDEDPGTLSIENAYAEDFGDKAKVRDTEPIDIAHTCDLLGLAHYEKCEYVSAILEFRKSVSLNGKNADVWFHLARALYETKEFEDAEFAVQKALTLDSASYSALSLLGKILHARGEHDLSIAAFKDALGLMNAGRGSDSEAEDVGSTTVGW